LRYLRWIRCGARRAASALTLGGTPGRAITSNGWFGSCLVIRPRPLCPAGGGPPCGCRRAAGAGRRRRAVGAPAPGRRSRRDRDVACHAGSLGPSPRAARSPRERIGTLWRFRCGIRINGHEWAERQATKAGIVHTALDNGFATCANPAAVQAICDRLGPAEIDALLRKWLAILPHPFTAADREAGYRYDISILQAEFSLTQVLDRPVSGRVFFEHVIRDNLDAGRPTRSASSSTAADAEGAGNG
jgi:hypothetical protein